MSALLTLLLVTALDMPGKVCKLHFAENYQDAWTEAEARNVPVLLLCFDGWEGDGGVEKYYDEAFVNTAQGAVLLLASQYNHGEIEQEVRGEKKTVCARYGGVPARTHQRMLQSIAGAFGEKGSIKTPFFIVATPDRKVQSRFVEETDSMTVRQALRATQKRMGAGLRTDESAALVDGVQRIDEALDQQDLFEAVRAASSLRQLEGTTTLHDALRAAIARVDEAGQARWNRAETRWTQSHEIEPLLELDELAFLYKGTPLGKGFAASCKTHLKSPEAKALSKEVRAEQKARELYYDARVLEHEGELAKALKKLKSLAKKYPTSSWTLQAASLITVLEDELDADG